MRIFQVCADIGVPPDGTRGSSVHLRSLAAALASRGHEVTTFTARLPGHSGSFPVPIFPLESPRSLMEAAQLAGPPGFIYERYALGHDSGLVNPAQGRDPAQSNSGAGLAAARQIGCPFVLEVNSRLVHEGELYRELVPEPSHWLAEERLFKEADLVVSVSTALKGYVDKIRGGSQGSFVIHNGCDPELFPEPARVVGTGPIVFLGDPRPWHGAERLPAMIAELVRRGHNPNLLVIGGGRGAESVMNAAGALGMGGRVEVTGALPQPDALQRLLEGVVGVAPYPASPLFYFCPIKILEYMASGLPVVTTSQGDLPEIVGETGCLVAAEDDGAFVDALEALLADPFRRKGLGAAARNRVMTRWTWDKTAEALEACVGALVPLPRS